MAKVEIYRDTSKNFLKQIKVDLICFVDGNHLFEFVKDILNFGLL